MDRYLVLKCPKCHKVITADGLNKSRTCPLCSHKIDLRKTKILFAHSSPRAAALAAQQAMERSTKARNPDADFGFRPKRSSQ
ncbi:MAG TPA: DUF1922 domain-containing protein [Thermoplasmata archaeon]|nr:DUF1922 domain-containing protein [Thermoplasmata archaeon]